MLKRIFTATFCSLTIFLVVQALLAQPSVEGHFDVEKGGRLDLRLNQIGGSIEIEGWERSQVEVKGQTFGRGWDENCGISLNGNDTQVTVSPDCDYRDHDRYRGAKINLKIKVPKKFDIRIEAAAETVISHVEGRTEISLSNADLDLSWVYGRAEINTANGRIYITDCKLEGDIRNTNGRLTIEKSSVQGNVNTTNSSMEISHAPYGIEVGSTNGAIRIGTATKFVRGRTTNGSVRIDELDGSIEVETVNGHVEAKLIGNGSDGDHNIDIETLNGNVELFLPEDFSMQADIEVTERNNKKRRQRYKIESDFELSINEVDYGRDDYEVTGKGSVRGGKNRVRVRAVNGDVSLRKAR